MAGMRTAAGALYVLYRERRMRLGVLSILLVLWTAIFAPARDCSTSKEFEIKKAQALAGEFQDQQGAVLSGLDLELLSGKKIVQHLRSSNEGKYDFGEVPPGRYKLRVRYGGDVFCAPKVSCGAEGCRLAPRLAINSKNLTMVY